MDPRITVIDHHNLPYPYNFQPPPAPSSVAFTTGLKKRDGETCVVCGENLSDTAHIVPQTMTKVWDDLKSLGHIPNHARSVEHDARTGLTLCPNHHRRFGFPNAQFFIRLVLMDPLPSSYFMLVNISREPDLEQCHGKRIRLRFDLDSTSMPYIGAFMQQERIARALHILPILPLPFPAHLRPPPTDPRADQDNDDGDNGDNSDNDDNANNRSTNGDDENNRSQLALPLATSAPDFSHAGLTPSPPHASPIEQNVIGNTLLPNMPLPPGLTYVGDTLTLEDPSLNPALFQKMADIDHNRAWQAALMDTLNLEPGASTDGNIASYLKALSIVGSQATSSQPDTS